MFFAISALCLALLLYMCNYTYKEGGAGLTEIGAVHEKLQERD